MSGHQKFKAGKMYMSDLDYLEDRFPALLLKEESRSDGFNRLFYNFVWLTRVGKIYETKRVYSTSLYERALKEL